MEPDGIHDEIELNEDSTKREDTAHEHGGDGPQIKDLVGDLSRDLVRAYGMFESLRVGWNQGFEVLIDEQALSMRLVYPYEVVPVGMEIIFGTYRLLEAKIRSDDTQRCGH